MISCIRTFGNFLSEDSLKMRKNYFCMKETGYLRQDFKFNQMANMMSNPDMMMNMVKSNIYSVFNIMLFQVIGAIFSGFVIAQFPFPLG